MSPPALTWSGVIARRMARHALAAPATGLGPADVAGVLCGAHAQVLSAAELSIGRRVAGATRTDVQRALWDERTLVKTFGPRGTIHLLPTADLPMWTGALSALPSPVPTHPEGVRFTPVQADQVIAANGRAPRDAVLRAGPGPQGDLHQPAPLAARLPPRRRRRGPGHARHALPVRVRPGHAAALRPVARHPAAVRRRAVRPAGRRAGARRAGRRAGMDRRRRHRDAAPAALRHPPAALLRRVRRRGPATGAAVPRRGRLPRAHPGGPGRELPGAARGRRGGWRVAPAALRP